MLTSRFIRMGGENIIKFTRLWKLLFLHKKKWFGQKLKNSCFKILLMYLLRKAVLENSCELIVGFILCSKTGLVPWR